MADNAGQQAEDYGYHEFICPAVVSACGGCADVYNLQGRLVLRNADASSVSRLPRGLYIVNGVKCVKK